MRRVPTRSFQEVSSSIDGVPDNSNGAALSREVSSNDALAGSPSEDQQNLPDQEYQQEQQQQKRQQRSKHRHGSHHQAQQQKVQQDQEAPSENESGDVQTAAG